MRVLARFLFAILPLALPGGALAQRQLFTVDPGTSHIAFSLGATGHDVHGPFHVRAAPLILIARRQQFQDRSLSPQAAVKAATVAAIKRCTTMFWTLRTLLK
jgi:hypothetical protein